MSLENYIKCNSSNVVEEFLKKFTEEQNLCTKAVALNSFAKSYLQISKENPEYSIHFSSFICPQVPELFGSLTQFDKTTYDVEKEAKVLNLQSAILCLEALLVCYEYFNTDEQLLSLLRITLEVLFQAYTHCERSEGLYSDFFEEFTDQLAVFYQKVQDIQNALMSQLDKFVTTDLNQTDILFISEELGKLCILVSNLDAMVATKLWRAFIKFVTHFSAVVQDRLKIDSVISSLLTSINGIISESKHKLNNQEKIEDSDVKIMLFLLNLAMKIIHIFHGCLNDNMLKLRNLLLELHGLFIICSIKEAENMLLLKNALISSISSLTSLFCSDTSFLTYILGSTAENITDLHMPQLFLLLAAFKRCNPILDLISFEQREASFKEVFKTLQKCKPFEEMLVVDLKLPQILFTGVGAEKECNTTLYEELYKGLSQFSMNIPDSYFCMSDREISKLFSSNSDVSSLLLSDVWVYRLRSSSVEKIHECCLNLSQDGVKIKSNIYLKMVFKRLLKFLPLKNKIPFLEDLNNHRLTHRYAIPNISTVPCEMSISSKNLMLLIDDLNKPMLKEESKLVEKADCILELFSLLVNVAKNEDILKFSEFAKILFGTEIYEIQIAVLNFMKAIKRKQLTRLSSNFEETTLALASLLTEVLKSSNYIVRHEALNTYLLIAQSTQHPEIFKTTQSPCVIPLIKSYCAKSPLGGFLSPKDRMKSFQTQVDLPFTVHKKISEDGKQVLYQLK